jgi:hypothetical protein
MFREFGNEFYGIEWKCGTMNEVKSHLAEHATNTLAAIGTGSVRVMVIFKITAIFICCACWVSKHSKGFQY